MHSLLLARRGFLAGAAATASASAPRRAAVHWQLPAQARALSSAVPKMDDFVKSALGEAGLEQVCVR